MSTNQNPIPQGKYVPATRDGCMIFTAGMTPRSNGVLIFSGKVKAEEPLETYRDAVRQAAANCLTAARNTLAEGEQIQKLLYMTVYINGEARASAPTQSWRTLLPSIWWRNWVRLGSAAGLPSGSPPSRERLRWRSRWS